MTHTLHPEILDEIVNSMNHYVDKHMYHALGMKKVLEKHLGPYLHMPQPIDNEPLPEKDEDRFEQLQDARIEYLEGSVSKIYKLIIKLAEKQNVANDDLKQSTPQIKYLVYEDILPDGKLDQLAVERNLANIIDYINNTLPTNKSNDQ